MYINKLSATKIEAADRVNLLHCTIYRFEQWKSRKARQMLVIVSLPRYPPFHDSHQKDSCFQTYKLNIKQLYKNKIDFKTTLHMASGSS